MPDREFTLEAVQDYILQHAVLPETLEKYLFFSKGNYTRNLIFKNDVFECMTICWEIGQFSRIHNHRDQNCWMSAPIGKLRVQNFRVDERDTACGTCHSPTLGHGERTRTIREYAEDETNTETATTLTPEKLVEAGLSAPPRGPGPRLRLAMPC